LINVYGFFVGDGVREEEEVVEVVVVVVVVVVVKIVVVIVVVGIEIIGMTFIGSSLLSVILVEVSGIVRLSRSIDLTGLCSCSSSSNISSISKSSAVPPFVFDIVVVVVDLEESFLFVVDSTLAGTEGTDTGLIGSGLICENDNRTGSTSIYKSRVF
jgi:hypothetical protein